MYLPQALLDQLRPQGEANVSVTGVAGTGAVGTVFIPVSVNGVVATGAVGSVLVLWDAIVPDQDQVTVP